MKKKELKLKENQINFLLKISNEGGLKKKIQQSLTNNHVLKNGYPTDQFIVTITNVEKEQLLNELTCLMTSIGIDSNGNATAIGGIIEDLIDLIISEK
jgi:hypothetical protein